jgi:hypothetical protein
VRLSSQVDQFLVLVPALLENIFVLEQLFQSKVLLTATWQRTPKVHFVG